MAQENRVEVHAMARSKATEHIQCHRDGSVWAKGLMIGGVATGYWEWFRKDGTKLRSGHFENGEQTGAWTTYDSTGSVYKVTQIKPKKPAGAAPKKKSAPAAGLKKATARSKGAAPKSAAARKKMMRKAK